MTQKIGFVALGHASVSDSIPGVTSKLKGQAEVLSCGALDGLTLQELEALRPHDGEHLIVCNVEPGEEALVSFQKLLPLVQERIYWLEAQGADLITILCGADWTELKSNKLLINPGSILPQIAVALSRGLRLGIVMPTILQVDTSLKRYRDLGADAVCTYITLYDKEDLEIKVRRAAEFLITEKADLVWMPCMGMVEEHRIALRNLVNRPVILAQSMLAKIINEIIC